MDLIACIRQQYVEDCEHCDSKIYFHKLMRNFQQKFVEVVRNNQYFRILEYHLRTQEFEMRHEERESARTLLWVNDLLK